VKYGQLFTAATQHFTPAVVKYKNLETKWSIRSINHNKITRELHKSSWNLFLDSNMFQFVCRNNICLSIIFLVSFCLKLPYYR
jgi:hypothetical protein